MSSTPKESPPKSTDKPAPPKPDAPSMTGAPPHKAEAESKKEQTKPDSAISPPRDSARDIPRDTPALNQGQVHPEGHEPPVHEPQKARLHMDQIDAVATPQGVVLFALTEGGEIWQLTTFSGQSVWSQILTPEAPAEDA